MCTLVLLRSCAPHTLFVGCGEKVYPMLSRKKFVSLLAAVSFVLSTGCMVDTSVPTGERAPADGTGGGPADETDDSASPTPVGDPDADQQDNTPGGIAAREFEAADDTVLAAFCGVCWQAFGDFTSEAACTNQNMFNGNDWSCFSDWYNQYEADVAAVFQCYFDAMNAEANCYDEMTACSMEQLSYCNTLGQTEIQACGLLPEPARTALGACE